jgi:Tfp pilus assembly protein PilF
LQKADRNFEIATSVKPEYADAYYMRGLIAEEKGDDKQAKYFYDQTLKLNPKHSKAIQAFGRLRNEKKK